MHLDRLPSWFPAEAADLVTETFDGHKSGVTLLLAQYGTGKSTVAARLFGNLIVLDECHYGSCLLPPGGPGPASLIHRRSIRGRSQSLILRTLGLLERKRQDLQELLRLRSLGRPSLAVQRRLFGVGELPGEDELGILKLILAGAIHSLATMVIRGHARYRASLTANWNVAGAAAWLCSKLLECIHRTVPRTELARTQTPESSAGAFRRPTSLRYRQRDGTRRLLS
jgi:hypothetical protein